MKENLKFLIYNYLVEHSKTACEWSDTAPARGRIYGCATLEQNIFKDSWTLTAVSIVFLKSCNLYILTFQN